MIHALSGGLTPLGDNMDMQNIFRSMDIIFVLNALLMKNSVILLLMAY
jgi:hypothetical protein